MLFSTETSLLLFLLRVSFKKKKKKKAHVAKSKRETLIVLQLLRAREGNAFWKGFQRTFLSLYFSKCQS